MSDELKCAPDSANDWAPARIWLQRGVGEEGSHTWCEDSIDECEQAEYVRVDAAGEPVAWIQPDHLAKARVAPFLCRVEPSQRDDFIPLHTAPPPASTNRLTDAQVVTMRVINGEVTEFEYSGNLMDGEYKLYTAAPTVSSMLTEDQAASLLAASLRFEAEGNLPMAEDLRAIFGRAIIAAKEPS